MSTVSYGEWPSLITAEAVVAASASLTGLQCVGDDVYWSELRPTEGGRIQIVRRSPDGTTTDLLPDGVSARTRVHEYGGSCWIVDGDRLFFNDWSDHRVYLLDLAAADATPVAISPEPATTHGYRHADMQVSGNWLVCVRERHDTGGEAANELVALPIDGDLEPVTLRSGADFVAAPRIDSNQANLAWFEWNHPDMPWDATTAWVAPLLHTSSAIRLETPTQVAGGPGISASEPRWHGADLHVIDDRTNWWNVYDGDTNLTPVEAEVGMPHWVFGSSRYGWLDDGRMVFAALSDGTHGLYVRSDDGDIVEIAQPFTEIASVQIAGNTVVVIGSSTTAEPVVARLTLPPTNPGSVAENPRGFSADVEILRPARTLPVDDTWFSAGQHVSFPSGDRTAHAIYYPPTNPTVSAPEGSVPPLLVAIHGGPTSAARAQLSLGYQYWTSRGFAIVDVNYGGSTGYGRDYRELLNGNWGVVDVEDCLAAAAWLADQGMADPERLCIRGGSAGGFTTLAALAFADVFSAGASSFGVADLTALAEETHKFESRYLDSMVGPYPERKDLYENRSPINHIDGFDKPLIVFQGLEDEVVPPQQSEMIVDALRTKGVPVAYLAFEGEQHGFRMAETVITVLQAELAFYGRVLGFTPAGELPEITIDNL